MNQYVGQKLGTYRISRQIGSGGFAEVYLGKHVQMGWDVAIKILKIHYPEATFRQEADILWKLHHPHIVKILGYDIENGTSYLAMEYAAKGSLRDLHPNGETLLQPLILEYVKQIAGALDYMHKQHLVHCDIKPQNFLVRDTGEVLLGDFGIATEAVTTSLRLASLPSSPKPIVGTLHYIAPEQWQGLDPTPATDQYALGVVVYEWLCGKRPFSGTNPQLIAQAHMYNSLPPFNDSSISEELEDVVTRALAKKPTDRFPSILDFAQALEDAIQNRLMFPSQPPSNQSTPQKPMGGGIWQQLHTPNASIPPSTGGGYNDPTLAATPQQMVSQPYMQGGPPFISKNTTSKSFTTENIRRKPPRFDRESLRDTSNQPFLIIGGVCDIVCAIFLFVWLHDLNWTLGLLLVAIFSRLLCATAIKRNIALPLAWILVCYETLAILGLVIALGNRLPILWIIAAPVAWLLNDFFYARKK